VKHLSEDLQVSCDDDGAHVATPIVAAGQTGVAVRATGPEGWRVEVRPFEVPVDRWVIPVGDGSTTEPIWGASELVVRCIGPDASEHPPTGLGVGEEVFRTADVNSSFEEFLPWCPIEEWTYLTIQGGPSTPTSAEEVRALVAGDLPTDRIEQAGYAGMGTWAISRNDTGVAAFVRFPERDGYACRGSGIFGT
jgi:hypothetical protein